MKEEYIVDDRYTVPEYVLKMTSEERKAEIERIEKEIRERKEKEKQKQVAV